MTITPSVLNAATVLQTADGIAGLSYQMWALIGIAVFVVIALIWLLTRPKG